MTKIKLCGLSRLCDIEAANEIRPDYIGFVFSQKSKRYIRPEKAAELKKRLCPDIKTVGVFTDEKPENIAALLESGVIEIAQLHGLEDDKYVRQLKLLCKKPVIQAFQIQTAYDIVRAGQSAADFVLLDAGAGAGTTFDWKYQKTLFPRRRTQCGKYRSGHSVAAPLCGRRQLRHRNLRIQR